MYEIEIIRQAEKDIKGLGQNAGLVIKAIAQLKEHPRQGHMLKNSCAVFDR